jgi:hypothetical protein
VTQQWYQSQWFDEGFDRLLISKVFLTKVVRRRAEIVVASVSEKSHIVLRPNMDDPPCVDVRPFMVTQ